MRSLRQKCIGYAWLVILTVVGSVAGAPVWATACGPDAKPLEQQSHADPAAGCKMMGAPVPCCCNHDSVSASARRHSEGSTVAAPGCACTIQSSSSPPADPAGPRISISSSVALIATHYVHTTLGSESTASFSEPGIAPPNTAYRATGPSRAPPVRLPICG